MSLIIREYVYREFINRLTIDLVKELNKKAIQISKSVRITKPQMIALLGDLFGYFPMFPMLFELIFSRFQNAKCNVFNEQSAYFIRTITVDDEMGVYELCCALTSFVKCEFKEKISLLFELSDVDDDGFINEKELRKMISTLLILFSNNTNSIKTNSTVLNQSLAYLEANATINMLLEYPGELKKEFCKERYISFELFYERLRLIPGYKAKFLSFYVNFKDCLSTKQTETTISLKKDNFNHYLSVSNEIILPQSTIDKGNDIRPPPTQIKIVKRRFNPLQFKRDNERRKEAQSLNSQLRGCAKSMSTKCNFSTGNGNSPKTRTNKSPSKEFRVSYLKIKNIEAKPGRLHLIASRNSSLPCIMQQQKTNLKKRRCDYKNVEELISEINLLSHINQKEDYSSLEMNKIERKVNELGVNTKKFLKNREFSNSSLRFGNLSLKKTLKPVNQESMRTPSP